jgi:hypothetical protein
MSTYFSKVIKAGERQREFNFRQTTSTDEARYSVDVPDEKGSRILFTMDRAADGQWKTTAQLLPSWVYDAEPALAEAIEENRKIETTRKK